MSEIEQRVIDTLLSVGVVAGDDFEKNVNALCSIFLRSRTGAESQPEWRGVPKLTLGEGIRKVTDGAILEIMHEQDDDGTNKYKFRLVEDLDVAQARMLRHNPNLGADNDEIGVAPRVWGIATKSPEVTLGTPEQCNLHRMLMDIDFIECLNALYRAKIDAEPELSEEDKLDAED